MSEIKSAEIAELKALVEKHFHTPYPSNKRDRTYIAAIISEMLDNPDGHGIYSTGKAYDRLELFVTQVRAERQEEMEELKDRIADLETRLDIALKSGEQWKKEALKTNNIEPPSITVPHESLTREMRFVLCLKMIDQLNQIELDNLIRELNKK